MLTHIDDFSQLCAKVSIPNICLIPIQANKTEMKQCVTFHFNEASPITGRALNMRRNTHFQKGLDVLEYHKDPV